MVAPESGLRHMRLIVPNDTSLALDKEDML